MLVSNKAFENRGAILRPFRAKDAEAEGRMVGRELGLKNHSLSTQKALLEKELLFLVNGHIHGLPFSCSSTSDVLSLFLLLSGAKPASIISYDHKLPPLPAARLQFGSHAPFYAKSSKSSLETVNLLIARELGKLEELERLLSNGENVEKLSKEAHRAIGICLGYPEGAVERYSSISEEIRQSKSYIAFLLESNVLITPSLWNAVYVPEVRAGEVVGVEQLNSWDSSLARALPLPAFHIASTYRKISRIEELIKSMQGETSWSESRSERLLRKAIEQAY